MNSPPTTHFPLEGYQSLQRAFELCEDGYDVCFDQGQVMAALGTTKPGSDGVRFGLCSSGSTAPPKRVFWDWEKLKQSVVRSENHRDWCWATPFRPDTFAGVQIALQAWATGGRVLDLDPLGREAWGRLITQQAHALCCTPTYIDLLLQLEQELPQAGCWEPTQITLGGEVLRERLGQRLLARFPHTRFTVIYATSELGVVLKTHRMDGWYEAGVESMEPEGWRIRDEVLEIKRNGRFVATDDLAVAQDGLVRILGRADGVANVGGTKVLLGPIEELAERVDGVRRAKAIAVMNSVTGQVVGLRFAIEHGANLAEVRRRLEECLRHALPKVAWPRVWDLDPLEPAINAKRRVS